MMSEHIPYSRQGVSQADIEAVIQILRSDFLTQGPTVPAFEEAVALRCDSTYSVAVNSGTSALHLACLALGVSAGDTVWTSPNTFVASANCALYCGAYVDFVDIDPDTWCLSPKRLRQRLDECRSKGLSLPKVVIPVHLSGQSCDMSSIGELGKEYGFHIIEDASHAIGSTYHGEPVGNCRYSDITVFSFHAVKAITTGEGGMALTNSKEMYERMSQLRTHGITRDPGRMTRKPDGPWYYEQTELGFNYRMNDIQAALGISQLNKLEEFVDQRRKLARHYDKTLAGFPVRRQVIPKWVESARHLYIVRVNSDRHHELFNGLQAKGFGVNLHYMPVHLQPYYRKLGFRENCFLEAEAYGREAISLPLYPTLSDKDQNRVIETLTALI